MMQSTDVLIVGGGLAGTATAYFLAREGVGVTLIEKHDLNMLASGANAGSIHAQIPHEPFVQYGEEWARIFAPTIRLMIAGIALWRRIGAELGVDLDVHCRGGLLVAENEIQMRQIEAKAVIERGQGLPVELLSRADLHALAPYLAGDLIGGAICPIEGKASPLLAAPSFARAAEMHGARILRETELRAITIERHGFTVETSRGPVRARRIVNAAGAGAGRVAAMVGVPLPIEGHPIQVSVSEPVAPLVPHLVYSAGAKLTLKQTSAGAYLIGGGWPARRDPQTGTVAVNGDSLRRNLAVACRVVPDVASARIVRTWPAIVNGTADWKPFLGEMPGVPGFFMNMFPWMGFTAGPVCARIVADLVLDRVPPFDLAPFSMERALSGIAA